MKGGIPEMGIVLKCLVVILAGVLHEMEKDT